MKFYSCKVFFGNITVIVVPFPSSLERVIFALCFATICFTMASPKPVPPSLRERPLSTR